MSHKETAEAYFLGAVGFVIGLGKLAVSEAVYRLVPQVLVDYDALEAHIEEMGHLILGGEHGPAD